MIRFGNWYYVSVENGLRYSFSPRITPGEEVHQGLARNYPPAAQFVPFKTAYPVEAELQPGVDRILVDPQDPGYLFWAIMLLSVNGDTPSSVSARAGEGGLGGVI